MGNEVPNERVESAYWCNKYERRSCSGCGVPNTGEITNLLCGVRLLGRKAASGPFDGLSRPHFRGDDRHLDTATLGGGNLFSFLLLNVIKVVTTDLRKRDFGSYTKNDADESGMRIFCGDIWRFGMK